MTQCTQCGNNALYELKGNMLCLNCYHKIKQIEYIDYMKAVTAANHAIEEMDYLTASYGVPSNSPKHQIFNFPQFLQQNRAMRFPVHRDHFHKPFQLSFFQEHTSLPFSR